MKTSESHSWRRESGLTLLELVVVIAILAVLSTVALRSLSGVADQSRFETTQRTLEQVREAIVGASNDRQSDGTLVVSGFIADMGRPPRAQLVTNADGVFLTLDELLSAPTSFDVRPATLDNGVKSSDADPEVLVPCGWRGPYLRLPVGASELTDGWGARLANPLPLGTNYASLLRADGTPAALGEVVSAVGSAGANGIADANGTGYDRDLGISIAPPDYTASLIVNLAVFDTNGNPIASSTSGDLILVKVFGPDTNNVGKISVVGTTNVFLSSPLSCSFVNTLTQGPRVIRAYFQPGGSGPFTSRSQVKYLTVRPGFNQTGLTLVRPF